MTGPEHGREVGSLSPQQGKGSMSVFSLFGLLYKIPDSVAYKQQTLTSHSSRDGEVSGKGPPLGSEMVVWGLFYNKG